ncbi:amino acid permease [Penicillium frequentans]|uniref:Amino acid permease n=1 Tax=Penicillium frequentans TaxID=3151616 RepID=A0AAD6CQC3_9EURO|nr:amino acid permease [Penicillium glabrum]
MEARGQKSDAPVTIPGGILSQKSNREHDNTHLRQIGKKPLLKRNFGILSIFGFSCTLLGTWEGLLGTFTGPLANGGSGGTVYAFIFGWIGTAAIFVVLSELTSMAPTAGGQYHWAAMLAPIKFQKFLSYITGWWAILGWQTALASSAFLTGTMIQGAATLGNTLYNSLPWQGTTIVWATLLCALVVNMAGGKLLPRIETVLLVVHILGFFGIMIPLAYMSDHKSKEEVFLQFLNSGGFNTQGLSWFVGMTSCAFGFAGGDAAVHMSEEVENASYVIPRALMFSVLVNGCLGFGMLIAVLFCVGDLEDALHSRTGYPFMEIFYEATNSLSGSLAMCSIILVIYCCSLMGLLAAASRQLWSFPEIRAFRAGIGGISAILALINIGSSVALEDVVSMAVSGLYLSYLMVLVLLLWRRMKGDIYRHDDSEDGIINVPGAKLVWGTFHCPGIWGTAINAFAILYIVIVVFFSFWPAKMHPNVEEMNWSVLGIGGV